MRKILQNKVVRIVAITMAVLFVAGLASYFSGGFVSEWFDKQRNPDNLIVMDDYVITEKVTRSEGVSLDVDELGVLTLDGKLESSTEIVIEVAELKLEPGTYTLTGCDEPSMMTYNLEAQYVDANGATQKWTADYTTTRTQTFTEDVTVKLVVRVQAGFEADKIEILPVLAKGKVPVDFYDDNGIWGL